MSILQYPETMNTPDLHIWNNAAFDNGDSEDSTTIKPSWSPLKPVFVNGSESLESNSSKENQSPEMRKSTVSVKSPTPIRPLHPNRVIENSQAKPLKLLFKQGLIVNNGGHEEEEEEEVHNERKIDTEIEEIEMEISRLSSKLEALRLQKAKKNAVERRGRIGPATTFMEKKQNLNASGIVAGARRGVSLGPLEILRSRKSLGKPEITPVQPMQSRRKSCFWKLQEINEDNVTKERGKCMTLSPKSRKTISKIQASKQPATTTAGYSKKPMKKEDVVISSIQPKQLFKDGDKLVSAKKPSKSGRVVASRYNNFTVQSTGNSAMSERRKRPSLPHNDKEDSKRFDKKQWEIPSEVLVNKNVVDNSSPFITNMPNVLPKIRTIRCTNDSPRDSGAAKKVGELIGRRSYFCADETVEPSVCQALSFAEDDDVEEK